MKLLIDGDIFPYKVGFAFNQEDAVLEQAKITLHKQIAWVKEEMANSFGDSVKKDVKIYLSDDSVKNFRYDVAKVQPYKGNRVDTDKPCFYKELKQELINRKEAIVVQGIEADDALGIEACKNPRKNLIVSMDKDMRMIPGWHWEMSSRYPYFAQDPGYLSLERRKGYTSIFGTGQAWLWAQMLMGDKADNIPGIPGYGPARVYKELGHLSADKMEIAVKAVYAQAGRLNTFKEIKELLWILREPR